MKNSNETIGNRTRDLPACSAVPQPTAPPRAPLNMWLCINDLLDFHPNFIPHKNKYGFEIIMRSLCGLEMTSSWNLEMDIVTLNATQTWRRASSRK